MCTCMLKVNNLMGLEEHLDKMLEQQQLAAALTHHVHTHVLMAFWVSTESKASWESYVTLLASAVLPALDI